MPCVERNSTAHARVSRSDACTMGSPMNRSMEANQGAPQRQEGLWCEPIIHQRPVRRSLCPSPMRGNRYADGVEHQLGPRPAEGILTAFKNGTGLVEWPPWAQSGLLCCPGLSGSFIIAAVRKHRAVTAMSNSDGPHGVNLNSSCFHRLGADSILRSRGWRLRLRTASHSNLTCPASSDGPNRSANGDGSAGTKRQMLFINDQFALGIH